MSLPSDLTRLVAPARKVRPRAPIVQPIKRLTSGQIESRRKRETNGYTDHPFLPSAPLFSASSFFTLPAGSGSCSPATTAPRSQDFRDTAKYNNLFICRFTIPLLGAYLLATYKSVNRGTTSSFTTVRSSPGLKTWGQSRCVSLIFYLFGVENAKKLFDFIRTSHRVVPRRAINRRPLSNRDRTCVARIPDVTNL